MTFGHPSSRSLKLHVALLPSSLPSSTHESCNNANLTSSAPRLYLVDRFVEFVDCTEGCILDTLNEEASSQPEPIILVKMTTYRTQVACRRLGRGAGREQHIDAGRGTKHLLDLRGRLQGVAPWQNRLESESYFYPTHID